jgi:hypothetical protein
MPESPPTLRTERPQRAPRLLFNDEVRILKYLGGNGGGFTTHCVTVGVFGNAELRQSSQLTRQVLLKLKTMGLVEPMDDEKPIVWRRTKAGTEALRD